MKPQPCVGSGMCCKKAPCGFGESIDAASGNFACKFLQVKDVVEGVEIYECGKYEEIKASFGSEVSPAFGAGCCMSLFNDNRNRILALVRKGKIDLPYGQVKESTT